MAPLKRRIFVTGGRIDENGNKKTTNEVQMYSVDTNTWSFCAPMIQERGGHSVNVHKWAPIIAS